MNNEIKEILDKLTDEDWYEEKDLTGTKWIELKQEETNLLYDYITNLQEIIKQRDKDIETLLKTVKVSEKKIKDLQEENQVLKNQLDFIEKQNRIIDKLERHITELEEEQWEEKCSKCSYIIEKINTNIINYKSRNEKAIEYLANCDWNCKDFENLYDILGGDE